MGKIKQAVMAAEEGEIPDEVYREALIEEAERLKAENDD